MGYSKYRDGLNENYKTYFEANPDLAGTHPQLYDANNPYFRSTNEWPGWSEVLPRTLATADSNGLLKFRAISWQELVPALPLPAAVRAWAAEKNRLN
ncbi:MAG: hypothetical protein ACR2MU_00605 [Gaiellaceae bacterium]